MDHDKLINQSEKIFEGNLKELKLPKLRLKSKNRKPLSAQRKFVQGMSMEPGTGGAQVKSQSNLSPGETPEQREAEDSARHDRAKAYLATDPTTPEGKVAQSIRLRRKKSPIDHSAISDISQKGLEDQ